RKRLIGKSTVLIASRCDQRSASCRCGRIHEQLYYSPWKVDQPKREIVALWLASTDPAVIARLIQPPMRPDATPRLDMMQELRGDQHLVWRVQGAPRELLVFVRLQRDIPLDQADALLVGVALEPVPQRRIVVVVARQEPL